MGGGIRIVEEDKETKSQLSHSRSRRAGPLVPCIFAYYPQHRSRSIPLRLTAIGMLAQKVIIVMPALQSQVRTELVRGFVPNSSLLPTVLILRLISCSVVKAGLLLVPIFASCLLRTACGPSTGWCALLGPAVHR
eukprot:6191987-Pleurochrysis_carterae.AAC.2